MNQEIMKNENEMNFFTDLCMQLPLLIIKTQCGLGKYKFNSIGTNKTKMVIRYKLISDGDFQNSDRIAYFLGDYCYFNAEQFLYACKHFAIA